MDLVFLRPLQGPFSSTSWTLDVLKGHINYRHAASHSCRVCDGSSCVCMGTSASVEHTRTSAADRCSLIILPFLVPGSWFWYC